MDASWVICKANFKCLLEFIWVFFKQDTNSIWVIPVILLATVWIFQQLLSDLGSLGCHKVFPRNAGGSQVEALLSFIRWHWELCCILWSHREQAAKFVAAGWFVGFKVAERSSRSAWLEHTKCLCNVLLQKSLWAIVGALWFPSKVINSGSTGDLHRMKETLSVFLLVLLNSVETFHRMQWPEKGSAVKTPREEQVFNWPCFQCGINAYLNL